MNGALFLQQRSKRHMARLMQGFEEMILPHLPAEGRRDVERFKGLARQTIQELTGDGCDVIGATERGEEINGYAVDIRDQATTGAR